MELLASAQTAPGVRPVGWGQAGPWFSKLGT